MTIYARRPIRVRSLSSVTFPLTSRTSGTSITDIKEKIWVRLGIRLMKSRFIQCATTERARKRLFEDMNSGRVPVLFGSRRCSVLGSTPSLASGLCVIWRYPGETCRHGAAQRSCGTWGQHRETLGRLTVVDVIIYGTRRLWMPTGSTCSKTSRCLSTR